MTTINNNRNSHRNFNFLTILDNILCAGAKFYGKELTESQDGSKTLPIKVKIQKKSTILRFDYGQHLKYLSPNAKNVARLNDYFIVTVRDDTVHFYIIELKSKYTDDCKRQLLNGYSFAKYLCDLISPEILCNFNTKYYLVQFTNKVPRNKVNPKPTLTAKDGKILDYWVFAAGKEFAPL